MNPKNTAIFVSIVGGIVTTAGGCLDLKTVNSETTGGQGGSAGSGQGGTGAESTSSSSSNSSSNTSSGSSSTSSSSSSSGGNCSAGENMACYPGPADTQFKGACQAGQMTCDAGMWSGCTGFVLPILEACSSIQDTNCDGRMGCKGVVKSSISLGTLDDDAIVAIANGVGSNGYDGAVYGAGYRSAVVAIDGTPDSAQVLFVKRNPLGDLVDWSDKFNIDPSGHAFAKDIAVSPQENVVVVGIYQNASLSVNGQGLKAPGSATLGFLASFDSAGTLQFAKDFGSIGITEVEAVSIDGAGNIYIGGKFNTSINLGNDIVVANGGFDGFVASYTSTGTFRWRQSWSGPGDQSVDVLSAATSGAIYTGATFTSSINVGGGTVLMAEGGTDGLISALDPTNGTVKWHNHIGDAGEIVLTGITSYGGNIALVAAFRGLIAIGAATYDSMDGPTSWDTVVATLESGGGAVMATYPFVSSGSQVGVGIAMDSFGDIVVDGYFSTSLPMGGTIMDLSTGGDVNAFVVKFDSALNPRWGHSYGNSLIQAFTAVSVEPTNGHIFIGGGFQGILLGFGLIAPQTSGGFDAVLGVMTN